MLGLVLSVLGFPSPTSYSAGVPSPFDIAGISAAIDRAAASLAPDERGSLTVQVDQSGAGAGLIVRLPLPGDPKVLATVTKPVAGRFGWSLSARVAFLAGQGPVSVRIAPKVRGLFRLFRLRGDNPVAAAIKAVAANRGFEVRLGR